MPSQREQKSVASDLAGSSYNIATTASALREAQALSAAYSDYAQALLHPVSASKQGAETLPGHAFSTALLEMRHLLIHSSAHSFIHFFFQSLSRQSIDLCQKAVLESLQSLLGDELSESHKNPSSASKRL